MSIILVTTTSKNSGQTVQASGYNSFSIPTDFWKYVTLTSQSIQTRGTATLRTTASVTMTLNTRYDIIYPADIVTAAYSSTSSWTGGSFSGTFLFQN